ncbi:MAG: hypothetical protein F6K09_13345 [Merismopedia sp. SIO2A8]|nr:hypothetical protein [Merismopedia sp. SIO2A8]
MTAASAVQFTVNFNDPDFDDDERDREAQNLLRQLNDLNDLDVEAKPAVDPNPPEGSKPFLGLLVGALTAEVNFENAKALMGFLGNRLAGKSIELKVEANGRSLEVSASSQAELEAAIDAAKEFLSA